MIPSLPSTTPHPGELEEGDKPPHFCSHCGYAKGYDSDINSRIDCLSRLVLYIEVFIYH